MVQKKTRHRSQRSRSKSTSRRSLREGGGFKPQKASDKMDFKSLKANEKMSMTELQLRARYFGIPFGGLSKSRLVYKINKYAGGLK